MTRWEWLRRTFGGLVGAVCAPQAVTLPLRPAPLPVFEVQRIAGQILFMGNFSVRAPRLQKVLYGIAD